MKELRQLIDGIARRVNMRLNKYDFNTDQFVHSLTAPDKLLEYCASYDATSKTPVRLNFHECNIAGSHFLGNCRVDNSVVYKSDVRGDELKRKGDRAARSEAVTLSDDEVITISNSFLFKMLIHSNSYNLDAPEEFSVVNSVAAHYSTIHGSTLEGCYVGAFATVDRTTLHACRVGEFSYVQVDDLAHKEVPRGTVRVENEHFSFCYTYPEEILDRYISLNEASQPIGVLYDFAEERKTDLERGATGGDAPRGLCPPVLNRFAVTRGRNKIGKRVVVCQRTFVENSEIADGSTVQENALIIDSKLSGLNIIAHGAKVMRAASGTHVFIGMNSFLNGKENAGVVVGEGCIIMPHTIIDSEGPIEIPAGRLVWGYIASQEDVDAHSIALVALCEANKISMGEMRFEGKGELFVGALKHRIETILESTAALCEDEAVMERTQDLEKTQVFTIQPYGTGPKTGIYPTIRIEQ